MECRNLKLDVNLHSTFSNNNLVYMHSMDTDLLFIALFLPWLSSLAPYTEPTLHFYTVTFKYNNL
jgi:hypothetical protein